MIKLMLIFLHRLLICSQQKVAIKNQIQEQAISESARTYKKITLITQIKTKLPKLAE